MYLLIFDPLEIGCVYKKENMRQAIRQRDHDTDKDNVVIIILFSPSILKL